MNTNKFKYAKWRVNHLAGFIKEIPREVWGATKTLLKRGELFEACVTSVALPPYALIYYLTYFDEYETPPWEKVKTTFDKTENTE